MLNVYIILIDTITVSSTSWFDAVYYNFNSMNRRCKHKRKEITNIIFVDLYYIFYYVWANVYWKMYSLTSWFNSVWTFHSIAWQEVASIKVKKLEILFLCNFIIIIIVYYIFMLFVIKKHLYDNCSLGLHVKYL